MLYVMITFNKMNQSRIYYILSLDDYLRRIVGPHYPREIVVLISGFIYESMKISCGGDHTVLLSKTNKIYVWGSNASRQLGFDGVNKRIPTEFILDGEISLVSCGYHHTISVKQYHRNQLYVWGRNVSGQLGLNITRKRYDAHDSHHLMGEYYSVPNDLPRELVLPIGSDIKSISCGGSHTISLMTNGSVYGWGCNYVGQLGIGKSDENIFFPRKINLRENITSVSCGGNHTTAIGMSGKCYVWGYNKFGQLGLGDCIDTNQPRNLELVNVIVVSCGAYHTIALISSGTDTDIYAWGNNYEGQLGLGSYDDDIFSPRKLSYGFDNSCVISISCGEHYTMGMEFSPLGKSSSGYSFSEKRNNPLTNKRELYTWGDNCYGQLGLGRNHDQTSPQKVVFGEKISSVVCGESHTIIMTIWNKIYVCGRNDLGQLGLGDTTDRSVLARLDFNIR